MEEKEDPVLGTPTHHPSYGMIGVSRYTCTPPQALYGSSVHHSAAVSIRIYKGHKSRTLANESYFGHETLIEVNMSAAQYADMIASPNTGNGVPCTLQYLNPQLKQLANGKVEKCPEENEGKRIHDDFKKQMKTMSVELDALVTMAKELQDKPTINKADRAKFLDIATTLQNRIQHGMPFIHSQFTESMEHVVTDAKANLQAFVDNLSRSLGDPKLKEMLEKGAVKMLPE